MKTYREAAAPPVPACAGNTVPRSVVGAKVVASAVAGDAALRPATKTMLAIKVASMQRTRRGEVLSKDSPKSGRPEWPASINDLRVQLRNRNLGIT